MMIKTIRKAIRDQLARAAPSFFAKSYGQMYRLQGRSMQVRFEEDFKLFSVTDDSDTVYVARSSRLHYQMQGVIKRQEALLREYTGDVPVIRRGDWVIDCGANIGEFSLCCNRLGANVFAFEPDPTEFRALERNSEGRFAVYNLALWNTESTLDFFDKNESGDSSIFEPKGGGRRITVKAAPLDSIPELRNSTERFRLLKLEAEGAEPEILDGAGELLSRIDYVAVDMGPERGMAAENTVVPVIARLYAAGFTLVHFNHLRCTGLFRSAMSIGC